MAEPKQKIILLVEDEKYLREMAAFKLEKSGFRVLVAENADKAFEILKTEKPDLIWSDILMPGMSGLEFAEKVKSNEETKDIPIVMVSVSGGPDMIEKAFAIGVSDYVVKSQFSLDRIIDKIKVFFK